MSRGSHARAPLMKGSEAEGSDNDVTMMTSKEEFDRSEMAGHAMARWQISHTPLSLSESNALITTTMTTTPPSTTTGSCCSVCGREASDRIPLQNCRRVDWPPCPKMPLPDFDQVVKEIPEKDYRQQSRAWNEAWKTLHEFQTEKTPCCSSTHNYKILSSVCMYRNQPIPAAVAFANSGSVLLAIKTKKLHASLKRFKRRVPLLTKMNTDDVVDRNSMPSNSTVALPVADKPVARV